MKMLDNLVTVTLLALPLTSTTMAKNSSSFANMTGFIWPTPTTKLTHASPFPSPSLNLTTPFHRRGPPPAKLYLATARPLPSLPPEKEIFITNLDAFIIMVSLFGIWVVLCLIIFLCHLRAKRKARKLRDIEMAELGLGETSAKKVRKGKVARAPRWWMKIRRRQKEKKEREKAKPERDAARTGRKGRYDRFEEQIGAEFVVGTPSELGEGDREGEGDGDLGTAKVKFTD